jgi:hypothetical protein
MKERKRMTSLNRTRQLTNGLFLLRGITMKSFCLKYLTVCLLVGTIHAQAILPTQFGFHQDHILSSEQPADIGFGTFRTWDTGCCQWYQIEKTQGQYTFTGADTILEELKGDGINDVLVTFGVGVPTFYTNSTNSICAYSPGTCYPPTDVNSDGTGTDAAWIAFLQNAVAYFSNTGYLQNHAHVLYYELFNEFDRSSILNSAGCTSSCQFQGTFSQLLRMQEDARCVIQGVGTIHARNVSCANSGISPRGIDPAATAIAGNVEGGYAAQRVVLQNFLYCNSSPPAGSQCNWNGTDWGASADPVIVLHYYFANVPVPIPELVINRIYLQRSTLLTAEQNKPYFAGEGSWLKNYTQTDPGLSAGFTARWWLSLLLAQHFATGSPGPIRGYWYNWDGGDDPVNGYGGLWSTSSQTFNPPASYLSCGTQENGGYICTGGTAAKQIISWLVGQTWVTASCPSSCTNPTQGVFKIDITGANGYQAEIAWDSTPPTQACSLYAHPQVCGNTSYTAPGYVTQYRDLAGGTHTSVPKVIGAEPIIAEN